MEALYQKYLETRAISTDTRKIVKNSLFFALKGPNFNANAFAAEALQRGARYAVIDEAAYQADDRYILVDDALAALQNLARHHRKTLAIPVIGITGSNGKTTTKELVDAVLKKKYNTLATVGNLNNQIGVPLTMLKITPAVEIAIIEMGASKVGDIEELSSIAIPTHGLITNFGKAHLGGFGGFEGVIKGKSELYQSLLTTGGVPFLNSNNDIQQNMGKRFKNAIYFPGKEDFLHCKFLEAIPYVRYESESGQIVETNLIGRYNFDNICAALCIGKLFEVEEAVCHEAVRSYIPDNNRSQIIKREDNTIVLDAYNANPDSMKAAIANLMAMKSANKAVILGDMLELGEVSEVEHRAIAKMVAEADFQYVFFCGPAMKTAADEYPEAQWFEDKSGLVKAIQEIKFRETTILIKASRGMGLEVLLEHIV